MRNAATELKSTIGSVLGQDYPNLEFILIDGGSTDGTVEVIRSHAERIAFWSSEPDRGIYDAMNKGLARATGDWVNFMNAGDSFAGSDTISTVFAGGTEGFEVVYGDSVAAYPGGLVLRRAGTPDGMIRGMIFCHQAAFVRRELFGEQGFDLSYPIGADFKIFFGLYAAGHRFRKLPFSIAIFDASGVSNSRMIQSAREHYDIVRNFRQLTFSQKLYHYGFIGRVWMLSLAYRVLPARLVLKLRGMVHRARL